VTEQEVWNPVVGDEGSYEVSDLGRVRSLDRTIVRSSKLGKLHSVPRRGGFLKPGLNRRGYRYVNLRGGTRTIHRLVLQAFVGPAPEGHEAAHWDGNRQNNKLSNLRWATRAANQGDRHRHGTALVGDRNPQSRKTQCPRGHPYDADNTGRTMRGRRICRTCGRERARRIRGTPPSRWRFGARPKSAIQ
jgi:hypothetical protein